LTMAKPCVGSKIKLSGPDMAIERTTPGHTAVWDRDYP
jgi:hypothetical protein